MIDWAWLGDHLGAIAERAGQHLWLTAIALAVGFALSFLLALWSLRRPRVYFVVSGLAGILYTIPSYAMFAAFVAITGLSIFTAEIPLVLYTFVIFIRNIVVGLEAVPADVIEAADAMGLTARQRLVRVEIPLAVPLVIAGLRLAGVSTIGLVTITSILGDSFGGLGFFIRERPFFATEVLVGAVGSIALALTADAAFAALQRRLTPWTATRTPIWVDPREALPLGGPG
ncbi:MAG: ABC transporter permease subunit [Chloroflexi bacterium]|nr:ABC transporter permease subunit [Chloroflexota bacterium]